MTEYYFVSTLTNTFYTSTLEKNENGKYEFVRETRLYKIVEEVSTLEYYVEITYNEFQLLKQIDENEELQYVLPATVQAMLVAKKPDKTMHRTSFDEFLELGLPFCRKEFEHWTLEDAGGFDVFHKEYTTIKGTPVVVQLSNVIGSVYVLYENERKDKYISKSQLDQLLETELEIDYPVLSESIIEYDDLHDLYDPNNEDEKDYEFKISSLAKQLFSPEVIHELSLMMLYVKLYK